MGSHSLLQGIFPTQRLNPGLLHCRQILYHLSHQGSFPSDSAGKESACNAGDTGDVGSIPGSGRFPGGRNDNSLQYSCLKNPMDRGACPCSPWGERQGQGSLAGYSPKGHEELDTSEQLNTHTKSDDLHAKAVIVS